MPCHSPVRIYNKYSGEYLTVPCGNCPSCRDSRQETWSRRIFAHASGSSLVIFFTLTYDNAHLPLVSYDDRGFVTDFQYSSSRTFYNRHSKEFSVIHKRVSSDEFNGLNVFVNNDFKPVEIPPHFVLSRYNGNTVFDKTNRFAICYGSDLQLYIKRLRVNLRRFFDGSPYDPSFTYFAVSEYGPETFRPHFHGLLFFRSSPSDIRPLLDILRKTWGKSLHSSIGTDFEIVSSRFGCSRYVSKYVCKDTCLPLILQCPSFRTKSYKSISIPIGSQSFDISTLPRILDSGTLLYDEVYYDKKKFEFVTVKRSRPRCSWSRVFPKFVGIGLCSPSLLREIFDRIYKYKFDPTGLPNLVKEFPLKYPVGVDIAHLDDEYVKEFVHRYLGIPDPFSYPRLRSYLEPCVGVSATYSYFYKYLLSSDLDFYLFGIPQNRAACLKILRNSTLYDFLDSSFKYYSFYNRYHCLNLSDNIRYQNSLLSEEFSLDMFLCVYPDFADSLYPDYNSYTSDQISIKNITLSSFGLKLSDFYDSRGIILPNSRPRSFLLDDFNVSLKKTSHQKSRLYNYNKYQDL